MVGGSKKKENTVLRTEYWICALARKNFVVPLNDWLKCNSHFSFIFSSLFLSVCMCFLLIVVMAVLANFSFSTLFITLFDESHKFIQFQKWSEEIFPTFHFLVFGFDACLQWLFSHFSHFARTHTNKLYTLYLLYLIKWNWLQWSTKRAIL